MLQQSQSPEVKQFEILRISLKDYKMLSNNILLSKCMSSNVPPPPRVVKCSIYTELYKSNEYSIKLLLQIDLNNGFRTYNLYLVLYILYIIYFIYIINVLE